MSTVQRKLNKVVLKPVRDLELTVRAYVGLFDGPWGNNPRNLLIGELIQYTEEELAKYRGFAGRSLAEIREVLAGFGLQFGMKLSEALKAKIIEARKHLDQ